MSSEREIDPSTPLRWRSLRDMTPEERARFDERERQIRETLRHQPIAEIRLKIYAPEEGRDAEVYWEVRHPSEMLASSQVRPPRRLSPIALRGINYARFSCVRSMVRANNWDRRIRVLRTPSGPACSVAGEKKMAPV